MNKTAVKNFAIWARNKLIAEITYKAGLLGITDSEVKSPLPQSTQVVQFFDIGTREPYSITGVEIEQRKKLAEIIQRKAGQTDYKTAFQNVVEEVAYTWFNRLIAVRFTEVNDYLPTHVRVLSSESSNKVEPDLITNPMDAELDYTPYEKDRIMQLKSDNQLDELFRMLFIKQCNALNAILPELFEKTHDYTELLLNVSFTDQDGVVYHLVHDIAEDDFNVAKEGQVEIIGWLYQYYNTEPKEETFALLKKNVKITKERIPTATQLFTPDWIVRYMVENSLGRLWLERERASSGLSDEYLNGSYFGWKYYLEEAEQEPEVEAQLSQIREEYKSIKPEDIKIVDPCMGSGHILVYAFEVLMQIYESYGYSRRDAAKSIIENNLYGLDIDDRAYQLAYFAVMMKARQYHRRILNGETKCHVYSIQESNGINRGHLQYFGAGMSDIEKDSALTQIQHLLDTMTDAKEYGSFLNIENLDWTLLNTFVGSRNVNDQLTFDTVGLNDTQSQLCQLVEIAAVMANKYDVVVTNPPYMGSSSMGAKLSDFVKREYPDSKSDLFAVFIQRCGQITKKNCYQAMITQHAWMFLSSFEKLREKILRKNIVNMVHLGARAFEEIGGEVVQTTSFVFRNSHLKKYQGSYVRLVDYSSQKEKESAFIDKHNLHTANQENFSKISRMPIAYWVSDNIIGTFEYKDIPKIAEGRMGLTTGNNDYYLRLWYEVSSRDIGFNHTRSQAKQSCLKWFPYNKGGSSRKWYGNREYVVNWLADGNELQTKMHPDGKRIWAHNFNLEYIFKKHISWSDISSGSISFRAYEEGFLFDSSGAAAFVDDSQYYSLLGYLNTNIVDNLARILNPTFHFKLGDFINLPYKIIKNINVDNLVKQNIQLSACDWDSFETSWDFVTHPLIAYKIVAGYAEAPMEKSKYKIKDAFASWESSAEALFNQLKKNEEELNRIFIEIYGLQDELTPEVEDKDVTIRKADLVRDIRSFISYAIGCMFGRYSLDVNGLAYAGGEWDDSKYSTFIPDKDNILPITDGEYFEDDIVGLFCTFLKKTFGTETLEENLDFIAKALGNSGNTSRDVISNYFLKDFFKDHCKIYQKRPIYWLFDSGKADGFKALVYLHRYNEDTIGKLRIDYLHRMQRIYESEIAGMQETIENSPNAREVSAATKRKEKLVKQLKETKEYDEKIAHLALARIAIDLDDGVKVNYEKVQTGTDGQKLNVLAKI
ncbi:BREX-1 system adenine-specific DNA-methyltransferase PglX [Desulfoscipio gibsoniae]|uniref:site-specific DNA-methyltransferase (adenine-specific) n=1 Tax=Desulfoscipio gibsoniae DSM 7213 TaxID=767817 RepID=R4KM63_9FIRM|nr:BREX-1 system adenine-specific DNA-methyltransferase PglX [Desulfoscipio gibsoniae]AGL00731.1 N-6 DNA Methylase/Eco57I restriction endonuclease [Desulfoscipio gibsoniae DSM 7213]